MDVLQLLDDELKDKNNWSLEEKARYLYIRSCQLFSYDPRYQCDLFWKMYRKKKMEKEIVFKKIDLRNILDFKVVCSSYSEYVYNNLLEELLNIFVFVHKGKLNGQFHEMNSFKIGKDVYHVDATGRGDIERIKMGLKTYSFRKSRQLKFWNDLNLKKVDKKIGYIEDEYYKKKLMQRINNLEREFYNLTSQNPFTEEINYFLYKMQVIKELFNEVNVFEEYTDAFFCLTYLLQHFFTKDLWRFVMHDDICFVNHDLVDISNDNWQFINVFDVVLNDEKFNYLLELVNGKYEFREVPLSEGEYYKKEFSLQKKI